jgi:imidazolonepropionase-like amidohydrolase
MRRLSGFAVLLAFAAAMPAAAQDATTVIHTSKLLDGKGAAMSNADIVVVNGRITRVGPAAAVPKGARVIDLRGRTVLPGLIDVHSHLTWYFNRKGRYHTRGDGDTPIESITSR